MSLCKRRLRNRMQRSPRERRFEPVSAFSQPAVAPAHQPSPKGAITLLTLPRVRRIAVCPRHGPMTHGTSAVSREELAAIASAPRLSRGSCPAVPVVRCPAVRAHRAHLRFFRSADTLVRRALTSATKRTRVSALQPARRAALEKCETRARAPARRLQAGHWSLGASR
jgi:hypothetical protein